VGKPAATVKKREDFQRATYDKKENPTIIQRKRPHQSLPTRTLGREPSSNHIQQEKQSTPPTNQRTLKEKGSGPIQVKKGGGQTRGVGRNYKNAVRSRLCLHRGGRTWDAVLLFRSKVMTGKR